MNTLGKKNIGIKIRISLLTLILILPGLLFGFKEISTKRLNNVAISGYDTVAYFTENKAIKGSPVLMVEWKGAEWRFSSQSNMHLFENTPEKYAPAFGGYCSLGISKGKPFACDAESYVIVKGKLYVLKNKKVRDIWLTDPEGYIVKAQEFWKRMTSNIK